MFFKSTALVVLLSFVGVALSSVGLSPPSVNTDYPGKCWHNKTEKAYAPDAIFTTPDCVRVTCRSDFSFEYATCGVLQTEPPCFVTDGDLSLEYPDCCPSVKCP